ncbi:hypothetical protein CJ030_MR5G023169 [Morella rubra]|uniref:Uncharacterized protein n=1 Tax=Morella rubra TaxID=262757 RepID=A0A6A1VQJ5_9ROSI|nr:hypothetical protein CJ030_MR5G023169 [Morella rubra]
MGSTNCRLRAITSNDNERSGGLECDVHNLGIVLLEVLSGRKAHDQDYTPPRIVPQFLLFPVAHEQKLHFLPLLVGRSRAAGRDAKKMKRE